VWTQTKAPTETEDGEKTRTCTLNLSHKETRPVAALNHTHIWGDWQTATPATCAAEGEEKRTCTLNATYYETQPIDKLIWGEWEIITQATSTTLAKGRRICPNGDTDEQDMEVCGATPFAPAEEFCQSPNVVKDLCGTATFTAAEFCQSPNVVKDLCGTATFTATQFCYNSSKVGDFCGINPQQSYNPDLYECKAFKNGIYLKGGLTDSRGDNKHYDAVLIGTQTWMAENLNYNASGSKCGSTLSGTGTVGDANTSACDTYGRLYNWATAMANSASSSANPSGVKGVCPDGWHLPSNAEWTTLTDYVGGSSTAGTKLKATSGWNSNGNGTDAHGFSALPGGRGDSGGSFGYVGNYGNWWSATENDASFAYNWYMGYLFVTVVRGNGGKTYLYSVRCVQD
jgi:uncharacterized protein (TIGR02145 family)